MPLSDKQKRQRRHIEETYEKKGFGPDKGRSVFYAMENKGEITGRRPKRQTTRHSRR